MPRADENSSIDERVEALHMELRNQKVASLETLFKVGDEALPDHLAHFEPNLKGAAVEIPDLIVSPYSEIIPILRDAKACDLEDLEEELQPVAEIIYAFNRLLEDPVAAFGCAVRVAVTEGDNMSQGIGPAQARRRGNPDAPKKSLRVRITAQGNSSLHVGDSQVGSIVIVINHSPEESVHTPLSLNLKLLDPEGDELIRSGIDASRVYRPQTGSVVGRVEVDAIGVFESYIKAERERKGGSRPFSDNVRTKHMPVGSLNSIEDQGQRDLAFQTLLAVMSRNMGRHLRALAEKHGTKMDFDDSALGLLGKPYRNLASVGRGPLVMIKRDSAVRPLSAERALTPEERLDNLLSSVNDSEGVPVSFDYTEAFTQLFEASGGLQKWLLGDAPVKDALVGLIGGVLEDENTASIVSSAPEEFFSSPEELSEYTLMMDRIENDLGIDMNADEGISQVIALQTRLQQLHYIRATQRKALELEAARMEVVPVEEGDPTTNALARGLAALIEEQSLTKKLLSGKKVDSVDKDPNIQELAEWLLRRDEGNSRKIEPAELSEYLEILPNIPEFVAKDAAGSYNFIEKDPVEARLVILNKTSPATVGRLLKLKQMLK